jgi:DNA-binding HxlR family transcriptional regulator
MKKNKSFCPVNQALEIIGDQWTLLIIRDIMFHGKRYFREFLNSDENIASNILTDRLNMLENLNIIIKSNDANHKQKKIYTLNRKGIDLIPVIAELMIWTGPFANLNEKDRLLVIELREGGKDFQEKLKAELGKEMVVLFNNNNELRLSNQKRFHPLVKRMSDVTQSL